VLGSVRDVSVEPARAPRRLRWAGVRRAPLCLRHQRIMQGTGSPSFHLLKLEVETTFRGGSRDRRVACPTIPRLFFRITLLVWHSTCRTFELQLFFNPQSCVYYSFLITWPAFIRASYRHAPSATSQPSLSTTDRSKQAATTPPIDSVPCPVQRGAVVDILAFLARLRTPTLL